MRSLILASVFVAGTAAKFLYDRLNNQGSQNNNHNDTLYEDEDGDMRLMDGRSRRIRGRIRRRRRPQRIKIYRHPQVHKLLNDISPVISGGEYASIYGDDNDCTCCLERMDKHSKNIRVTPCKHGFHADCLEEWVQFTATPSMDWKNYQILNDGTIDYSSPIPSCPNCNYKLPVLPTQIIQHTLLTAIAKAFCLSDLSLASAYLHNGFLFHANLNNNIWSLLQIKPIVDNTCFSHNINNQDFYISHFNGIQNNPDNNSLPTSSAVVSTSPPPSS